MSAEPTKFTYPFRYTPSAEVIRAAASLIDKIASTPELDAIFAEGKMMGTLVCREGVLYAFSGLAGGHSCVEGFVPPIFDYTDPQGHFRSREAEISAMEAGEERRAASRELQDWLFANYVVFNARGESRSVKDIFTDRGLVPPGGTGECAGPKLLNYAYSKGMTPLSMGEFWYGHPHSSKVREQGRFYPACTGKCGPLLTWMMQGLDVEANPLDAPFVVGEPRVIFEDSSLIVVVKPSGMLSVPGKTAASCLLDWLRERYGEVHSCHRLDQDTSGLMVYARNVRVKAALEAQFASRTVQKCYRARLAAGSKPFSRALKGTIALPLTLDYYDRPCQMVDRDAGKKAVTEYEVVEILPSGEVELLFRPHTGRTHQLRVHAAHPAGLGHPIKGDHLYGSADGDRLFLHACTLSFVHPLSGEPLEFND